MKIRPTNNIELAAADVAEFQHLHDLYAEAMAARMSEDVIGRCQGQLQRFMDRHGIEGFRPAL